MTSKEKLKDNNKMDEKNNICPISQKFNLNIKEAAEYFNIGENKLREMTSLPHCSFVLRNGRNILIKRKAFEEYLERQTFI